MFGGKRICEDCWIIGARGEMECPKCLKTLTMVNEWQPIETAPRNGTLVILYHADWNFLPMAYWEDLKNGMFVWRSTPGFVDEAIIQEATHWMPFPELPKEK